MPKGGCSSQTELMAQSQPAFSIIPRTHPLSKFSVAGAENWKIWYNHVTGPTRRHKSGTGRGDFDTRLSSFLPAEQSAVSLGDRPAAVCLDWFWRRRGHPLHPRPSGAIIQKREKEVANETLVASVGSSEKVLAGDFGSLRQFAHRHRWQPGHTPVDPGHH